MLSKKEIRHIKVKAWLITNAGEMYSFETETVARSFNSADVLGERLMFSQVLSSIQEADAELRGDMPKHEFYGSFLIR